MRYIYGIVVIVVNRFEYGWRYNIDVNCSWFLILNSLLWRRCAKPEAHFSNCWCRLLTANRLTCTGMGTTIFPAPPQPPPLEPLVADLPRTELPPTALFFCPSLQAEDIRLAFTRFHFARRFWNQIFTCRKKCK